MYKSKLKPPPKTNMMGGSALNSVDDLGKSSMNRSVRPLHSEIKKSGILSRKDFEVSGR